MSQFKISISIAINARILGLGELFYQEFKKFVNVKKGIPSITIYVIIFNDRKKNIQQCQTFLDNGNMYWQKYGKFNLMKSAATPGFRLGWGEHFWGSAWQGVPGAEPPGRRKIFENLQKNFLKKITKNAQFQLFFKKSNESCVDFWHIWTKNAIGWKNLRKF